MSFPDIAFIDDQGNLTTDIKWFYKELWFMGRENPWLSYDAMLEMDIEEYNAYKNFTLEQIEYEKKEMDKMQRNIR